MAQHIIGILFFLLYTSVGLLMRIIGKDAVARRLGETASSYRIVGEHEPTEKMKRPF
jgi:hypothetical protein